MAGKKVVVDSTEEEIREVMRNRAIAAAEVRKCDLMIKHYVENHGGIEAHGLAAYTTQTIKQAFDDQLVGAAMDELGVTWKEMAKMFTTTLINNIVLKSEYGADIRAILKMAPGEGMVTIYGKPITAVRTNPPDEGKVHVLQPGDKPMENTISDDAEAPDWGDADDVYDEAPLSPGD